MISDLYSLDIRSGKVKCSIESKKEVLDLLQTLDKDLLADALAGDDEPDTGDVPVWKFVANGRELEIRKSYKKAGDDYPLVLRNGEQINNLWHDSKDEAIAYGRHNLENHLEYIKAEEKRLMKEIDGNKAEESEIKSLLLSLSEYEKKV